MTATTTELDELLTLHEVEVLKDSDFLSSHGADIGAARKFFETELKNSQEPIPVDAIIEAAHPTPSHMTVFKLACGLQILLPVSKVDGSLTSADELKHNFLDRYFVTPEADVDQSQSSLKINGRDPELRRDLVKCIVNDLSWTPLKRESLTYADTTLANYTVKGVAGCTYSAQHKVKGTDGTVGVNLTVTVDRKNPQRVALFGISYTYFTDGGIESVTAALGAKYDNEGVIASASASTPKDFPNGFQFVFDEFGRVSKFSTREQTEGTDEQQGIDHRTLAEFCEYQERHPKDQVTLRQLNAAVCLKNMTPGSRLDYARSLKQMVSVANLPPDGRALQQFLPLQFS